MPNSMTAFASRELSNTTGSLRLEIKSVNHRFFEFSPKMPDEFRALEPAVRASAQKLIQRGKVDLYVKFKAAAGANSLAVNEALVEQLITLASDLHNKHPELRPMGTAEVLMWPGVMQGQELDAEALRALFLSELGLLLTEFDAARRREGTQLAQLLLDRALGLRALREHALVLMPQIRAALKEKLNNRFAELKAELDPSRLEAELMLALQKMDVDEELDRLRVHLDEVERVLGLNEPVGRRLDFLVQELHRECNTFGAKSADARSTQISVDMKVLVEQMREQLQNLE